jgi:hypothetical protein
MEPGEVGEVSKRIDGMHQGQAQRKTIYVPLEIEGPHERTTGQPFHDDRRTAEEVAAGVEEERPRRRHRRGFERFQRAELTLGAGGVTVVVLRDEDAQDDFAPLVR